MAGPTRRGLLAGSASLLASIGGCSQIGLLDGESPDPEAVVERFFAALLDRRYDDAISQLHPDSPLDPLVHLTRFPGSHLSLNRTRRRESTDDTVVVADLTTWYRGDWEAVAYEYALDRSDGTWRIYSRFPRPPDEFPRVAWQTSDRCQEVLFEHAGGDVVNTRANTLTATISAGEATLPSGTLERGDVLSVHGDTEPIPEATMAVQVENVAWRFSLLSIEWHPEDGTGESYTVGSFELRDPSDPHFPDSCLPAPGEG